jgi:hypothetical protein
VLLRALLLALLFAGFGTGLRYAVRTWLPELAGEPGTDPMSAPEETRGSRIDIVLGDDERPGGAQQEGANAPTNDFHAQLGPEDLLGVEESAAHPEDAALGELGEELSEDANGAEDILADRGDEPDELPGSSESLETGTSGRLDSLPDIALRDESMGTGRKGGSGGRRPPARASGSSPGDAVRDSVARQDPVTLVRALRTVLKKDEKG